MVALISTAVFAVFTLVMSVMLVIYKIAKDSRTHTNGFVKTTLKVFILLFDALLGYQTAMLALDILKMKPSEFKTYCETLSVGAFTHVFLTVIAIFALMAMLVFYRNVNRKIYVASGYNLSGKEIDADWQKKMEKAKAKAQKKADDKAAKEEKKAQKKAEARAKKIAKLEAEALEEKAAEPVEDSNVKTEAPAVEAEPEAEPEKKKVVAHRRKQ